MSGGNVAHPGAASFAAHHHGGEPEAEQRDTPVHERRHLRVGPSVRQGVPLAPAFLGLLEQLIGAQRLARHRARFGRHDDYWCVSVVRNWAMEARRSPAKEFSSVAAAAACFEPAAYCRDTSAT